MISRYVSLSACLLFLMNRNTRSQHYEALSVKGNASAERQFPYVVLVTNKPSHGPGYTCTGSLLSATWVVTGAHCYRRYRYRKIALQDVESVVRAGALDSKRWLKYTQERKAVELVLLALDPNKTLPSIFNNDLALVRVGSAFVLNEGVGTITLAKSPLPPLANLTCTIVGFGHIYDSPFTYSPVDRRKLFHATGLLDGNRFSCRARAIENRYGYDEEWSEHHLCVDSTDDLTVPCDGDTGGPLVCEGLLVGTLCTRIRYDITQQHVCGVKSTYHVYMMVGYFEGWLRQYIPELPESQPLNSGQNELRTGEEIQQENGTRIASDGWTTAMLVLSYILLICIST